MKKAEKGLDLGANPATGEAREVLATLDEEDLGALAARDIFEVARSLHAEPADNLPSALLQRLSTVDAQLVTNIASEPAPPAPPTTAYGP